MQIKLTMSSNSESAVGISLQYFYVYNSVFGSDEGEECKKILYFYPPDTEVDIQMKKVGLSEAIIKFSESFNPDQPCESLHTQKTRQLFYQPEDGYYLVMTVTIPSVHKIRDRQEYLEYQSDDVQDNVYLGVLKQSYAMYRLFKGTFTAYEDVEQLKTSLEHFFTRYIPSMKLSQADILDVFNGIQFLPLDKQTFLQVHCFVNLIHMTWSQVKYVAFLYNDQLIWSGLEQDDMKVLYQYLLRVLPRSMENELQLSVSPNVTSNTAPFTMIHYGKFINGPSNLQDASNIGKIPLLHIYGQGNTEEQCRLVTYRAHNAVVCMLFDVSVPLTMDVFRKLDGFLGNNLSILGTDIAEQCSKKMSSSLSELQCKFIYCNHMNLAQKSTVHSEQRKPGSVTVSKEVVKLLADINSDLVGSCNTGEIIMKTHSDCWVVGRVSEKREFYVVLNQKNLNLNEVNDEVQALCSTHLSNIFFHE